MRHFEQTANTPYPFKVTYPDEVIFAFNPQHLTFYTNSNSCKALRMTVSAGSERFSVEVFPYPGKEIRIHFDRMVQLMFMNPLTCRSLSVNVSLNDNGIALFSMSFTAIWGNLQIGERYCSIGNYNHNGKPYLRRRMWFRKYPFTVSFFSGNGNVDMVGYSDKEPIKTMSSARISPADYTGMGNFNGQGVYEMIPEQDFPLAKKRVVYCLGDVEAMDVFDETFDYTFHGKGDDAQLIELIIRDEEFGYYLRWIDRKGDIQYYLFIKGRDSVKTKLSSYQVGVPEQQAGMYFSNVARTSQVDGEVTCKCCAARMESDVYEYVASIATSPTIDLYVGINGKGEKIWLPVNIVASTHTYDNKEELHDMEITFRMPDTNTQTI